MVDENALIPSTIGRVRVKGLDVNFTSASQIVKSYSFGDEVIDAVTNQPVRLPGKPTYDSLTITTPYTVSANRKIFAWLKTGDSQAGSVAATLIINNLIYTYTKCSLSQSPISPAVDANGNQTTANFLTLVIEISNTSLVDIRIDE